MKKEIEITYDFENKRVNIIKREKNNLVTTIVINFDLIIQIAKKLEFNK